MSTKPNTVIKHAAKPWKVAGQQGHRDRAARAHRQADIIEAEKDGNPNWAPHAYKAALAAQTMVRAGDLHRPVRARALQAWAPRTGASSQPR
jgi:hypothetical protein